MKMDSGGQIVEKNLNHNHEPESEKSRMREKVTNGCKRQITVGRHFRGRKLECVKFFGGRKMYVFGALGRKLLSSRKLPIKLFISKFPVK